MVELGLQRSLMLTSQFRQARGETGTQSATRAAVGQGAAAVIVGDGDESTLNYAWGQRGVPMGVGGRGGEEVNRFEAEDLTLRTIVLGGFDGAVDRFL
ncbi:hypothetical protein [Actinoplanes sichuanensis]|uniref:Uncharacterized protein n=1 Tax=Actinoplanes sichuanensis TaxID=512349 RepID=A0ABW4A3B1_9ACTN|nr:hypothetical protein [Actinoplanes sichuanensis]